MRNPNADGDYRPPSWEWWAPYLVLVPLALIGLAFTLLRHEADPSIIPWVIGVIVLVIAGNWWLYKRNPAAIHGTSSDPDSWARMGERWMAIDLVYRVILLLVIAAVLVFGAFLLISH
jgi:hypothetical protein